MTTAVLRGIVTVESAQAEAKLALVGKQFAGLGSIGKHSLSVLGKDVSSFTQGSSVKLTSLGKTFASLSSTGISSLGGVGTAFAGVGAAAVAGIGQAVEKTMELASQTRTLSRQLGLTAEDASRLRVAGEELGIDTAKLSTGFGIFAKNVANANPKLAQYGIQAVRSKDGSVDLLATLGQISDKFLSLPPGLDRTAFAMNVFGRSGKDLLPILAQGSAGLAKLSDEAERMGLVFSQKDLDAARKLAIQQRQLSEEIQGLEVTVGTRVIPTMSRFADVLLRDVDALRDFGKVGPAAVNILGQLGFAAKIGGAGGPLFSLGGSIDLITGAWNDNRKAQEQNKAQFDRLLGDLKSGRVTADQFREGIQSVADPAMKAFLQSVLDAYLGTKKLGKAVADTGGDVRTFSGYIDSAKTALVGMTGSVSSADHAIRILGTDMRHIPKAVLTLWEQLGLETAIIEAQSFRSILATIPRSVTTRYQIARQLSERQHGGPVLPGMAYVVGEKRPELFVPNTPGKILPSVPAGRERTISSPAGGGDIHVHFHGPVYGMKDFDRAVEYSFTKTLGRRLRPMPLR